MSPVPSVETFLAAVENRCSCYSLTNTSPISEARVREIVYGAVQPAPSGFNVQSARAVVLLHKEHQRLWDMADALLRDQMPGPAYQALAPRVAGFRAAHGSVLWWEDQVALDSLRAQHPGIQHVIPECECRSPLRFFFFRSLSQKPDG